MLLILKKQLLLEFHTSMLRVLKPSIRIRQKSKSGPRSIKYFLLLMQTSKRSPLFLVQFLTESVCSLNLYLMTNLFLRSLMMWKVQWNGNLRKLLVWTLPLVTKQWKMNNFVKTSLCLSTFWLLFSKRDGTIWRPSPSRRLWEVQLKSFDHS